MSDNVQIDVNKVLQKLQNKLAEAITNNAILEARVEQLQERLSEAESIKVESDE